MRPFTNPWRALALAATLATLLSGCSEYFARRDAISFNAGNALAADRVTEVVDPWPRASANRDIAANGELMQAAVERYRTGRVIPPSGIGTSTTYGQSGQGQAGAPANNTTPLGPTVNSQASTK